MENQVSKPFNKRAFVTLMAAFSALGLPLTGLVNHLLAPGPHSFMRHAWMTAHNFLGIMFTLFAVIHISYNWRVLIRHVKNTSAAIPTISRETRYAAIILSVLLILAVSNACHAP